MNPAADTPPPPRASALSPFGYPIFRKVWLANSASSLGGLVQSVGASWLMLSLAKSADMVALVQASTSLPIMLLSLVAGAVADNLDRRRVMLAAQVFMFAVSVSLSICAWSGLLTPWLLLLFTFLIGCGAAFNAPAWQASVGDMVPRNELAHAVALNSMGFNIARSVGPAIGGAIVAAAGAAAAFAVNAVSYAPLIGVLARWKPDAVPNPLPREPLATAVGAGIRYVQLSPALLTVMARAIVFGFGASSVMALMPIVAAHMVGGGPLTYGLLLGAFGIGAVLGALGSARVRRMLSTEALVRWASLGFAVAAALTAYATSLYGTLATMLVAGASWVLALSTFNVGVQLFAPRWVVARAVSLYQMAAFGGIAAGSWTWGNVAEHRSTTVALLWASGVLVVCAVMGLRWRLAQSEAINLEPLRQWTEPHTVLPVDARTGPVVITIEYRIREADLLDFLAAMADRQRIRRRDGARQWALLRDLNDPELWVERYKTPTWADYVRLNHRITQNDAYVPARLRALHQGAEPPAVRRMIERQTSAPSTAQLPTPEVDAAAPVEPPH
ncbi:MAG TPA: MFS transporter [Xanthomonadales bacterium]|nr:MFS transporter [Xanthomonadales bacterium]